MRTRTTSVDYTPSVNSSNDWALLRLADAFPEWPAVRIANATDAAQAAPGTPAVIVGWGNTSEGGDTSDILREASIPILPDQTCSNYYAGKFVKRTMLCAGYLPGGVDTCQGDSGGPLFINDGFDLPLEVGIVSFGDGCARPDTPGAYTRVSGVIADMLPWLTSDPVAPVGKPTTTPGTVTNQVRGQATGPPHRSTPTARRPTWSSSSAEAASSARSRPAMRGRPTSSSSCR